MENATVNTKTLQAGYLTPSSGFFLDFIRLIAALTVAFTHARAIWFREKEFDYIPNHLSHGSVVVFFVLSGYVIAYTTGVKQRTANEYAVARLSRLYSVVLPALIFTMLVSAILILSNRDLLNEYSRDNNAWRYIVSLFFCNEIWFLSAAPLLNGVTWSLSYEFWFYVIFGCWLYRNNNKKGLLLMIIVILIAGPKIILMMPMWILGVLAYRLPKPKLTPNMRHILIVVLIIISVVIMLVLPQMPYQLNTSKLYWASPFISDFVAALFIALAFWLLQLAQRPVAVSAKIKTFRKIADLTFPIYMFHYPCLVLCKSFINANNVSYTTMYMAFLCTLTFCFLIGIYIEKWHLVMIVFFRKLFKQVLVKSLVSRLISFPEN